MLDPCWTGRFSCQCDNYATNPKDLPSSTHTQVDRKTRDYSPASTSTKTEAFTLSYDFHESFYPLKGAFWKCSICTIFSSGKRTEETIINRCPGFNHWRCTWKQVRRQNRGGGTPPRSPEGPRTSTATEAYLLVGNSNCRVRPASTFFLSCWVFAAYFQRWVSSALLVLLGMSVLRLCLNVQNQP